MLLAFSAFLAIRDAVLVFPLANVAHVVAVLIFFAAVAAMDARLLGWLGNGDPRADIARLRPIAIGALALLAASGTILFLPEAGAMVRNASFQAKFALIALALANVALVERALRLSPGHVSRRVRWGAGISLALWLLVAAAGRFIAYA